MSPVVLPSGITLHGERFIAEPGRYRLRIGVSERRSSSSQYADSNTFVLE